MSDPALRRRLNVVIALQIATIALVVAALTLTGVIPVALLGVAGLLALVIAGAVLLGRLEGTEVAD